MDKLNEFEAVFVDSGDQYQQSAYNRILNDNLGNKQNIWSWKNDRASVQIAVLSGSDLLNKVHTEVSDLTNGKNIISSANIKPSFVREVRAYTGHAGWYANNPLSIMPRGERENFPEVIYSDKPVNIKENSVQLIWVQYNIPKNATAGVYHGKITISAENSDKRINLSITLEVLDIMMPDTNEYLFDTEYWSHPYNVAYYYGVEYFSKEHLKILKQHMSLYKSLGGHAVTASIVEEAWGGQTYGAGNKIHFPSMIKWIKKEDATWQFDYTDFDKWVSLNKEIGIADKIICYSMMPWKNIVRYYDEKKGRLVKKSVSPANARKYNTIWKPFLEEFIKHLDEKGWFDTTYIGFDERRNMQTALDLIDSVKNKDGQTLKISAAFNDFIHNKEIFDRLDYASVGLQEIRNNINEFNSVVAKRREHSKKITMYTATEHVPNSFTKSIPVEGYWSIMFAGKLNATGFLRWAYDAWVKDPLRESTHWSFQAGDCFLVYPSEKDDENRESKMTLRLAKLDEGVRDINKLYIMKQKSEEFSAQIKKLLSSVKGEDENYYEFETMKKTDIWGRNAKWLTDNGKKDMLKDMSVIKQKIYEISKAYESEIHAGA